MTLQGLELRGATLAAAVTLFGDVPALLRRLRKRADRTQREAGEFVGVTGTVIGRYEMPAEQKDAIAVPLDTLDRLLVYYGVASLVQLEDEVNAIRAGSNAVPARHVESSKAFSEVEYLRLKANALEALEQLDEWKRKKSGLPEV